ncbi:phosphotransferase [bacterium]|nr:phosphotransferase [candidate division CSSED10-310 bacterium]
MKKFKELTDLGRIRRIGRLARSALQQYDLDIQHMNLLCFATNPLFRVDTSDGNRFVLRMGFPGWRTYDNLLAEAAWLEALNRDTDIGAPEIVRTRDGRTVLPVPDPEGRWTWHATLMTWIDGRLLAHALTEINLEKMGRLFSELHIHGKNWTLPGNFPNQRFDRYLSRGEPELLFSPQILEMLKSGNCDELLEIREHVNSEYTRLDPDDIRVIHCDLWHENIKVDHGKLRPFDFEDTILGYRLHDLAMGLLDLQETVGDDRYRDLLAPFRQGYESLLPWPSGSLELLQIGRMLWQTNWTARFDRKKLGQKVAHIVACFRYLTSVGDLRLNKLI